MKAFLKLDENVLKFLREKANKKSIQLEALLEILAQKNLADTLVKAINQELENLNAHSEKTLLKQLKKTQAVILRRIEKDEQLGDKAPFSKHLDGIWNAHRICTWKCSWHAGKQHVAFGLVAPFRDGLRDGDRNRKRQARQSFGKTIGLGILASNQIRSLPNIKHRQNQ